MGIKRLHHIGVILPTLEQVKTFMLLYGLEVERQGQTDYGGTIIFCEAQKDESPIEFIVPNGGKLSEFNKGKGGLHHICFEVDDLEETSSQIRKSGAELLEENGVYGGPHAKCNFVRPKFSCGILVELMEINPNFPE